MDITDELREYAQGYKNSHDAWSGIGDDLDRIADRIDAEYECMKYEYVREFEDWEADRDAKWVKLPVDADGVPIHVGDVMDFLGGMTVDVTDGHNVFFFADNWTDGVYCVRANELRHYQPPTVEDVLQELEDKLYEAIRERFASEVTINEYNEKVAQTIAEYAAKLRLADDK